MNGRFEIVGASYKLGPARSTTGILPVPDRLEACHTPLG